MRADRDQDVSRWLESLAGEASVGLGVLDRELRYLWVNGALAAINGLSPEEHVGRPVSEIVPDLAEVPDQLREVLRSGRAREGVTVRGRTAADPARERSWLASYHRLAGADGSAAVGVVVVEDTDRRAAELALQAERTFVRAAFDALAAEVAVLDGGGRVTYVNAAWSAFGAANGAPSRLQAGLGLDYLAACDTAAAHGDRLAADVGQAVRGLLEGREVHAQFEYPCDSPTEQRWFVVQATRMPTGGAVVAHHNITERKLAERDRDRLVERLQTNLLPPPARPLEAGVLTYYRPGERRLLLGGDFLDVLERPDATIAAVIGDVVGHGPEAAALGAQLRVGWRALVEAALPLDAMLPALHRLLVAEAADTGVFATVCCVWIDRAQRALEVVNAGHPPPLLITPDGVTELSGARGSLLSPLVARVGVPSRHVLPPHVSVVLYTDGLVEGRAAPGSRARYGLERLSEQLHCHAGGGGLTRPGLARVLDDIRSAHGGPLPDDQALLVIGAHAAPAPAQPASRPDRS